MSKKITNNSKELAEKTGYNHEMIITLIVDEVASLGNKSDDYFKLVSSKKSDYYVFKNDGDILIMMKLLPLFRLEIIRMLNVMEKEIISLRKSHRDSPNVKDIIIEQKEKVKSV